MDKFYESIRKILETGRAGKLGAMDGLGDCIYADGHGKFCAIGCLMPPETIKFLLTSYRYPEASIGELAKDKIFKITDYGLTLDQGKRLQYWHDRAFDESSPVYGPEAFLEMLEGIFHGEVTEIAYHPFGEYRDRISMLPNEGS